VNDPETDEPLRISSLASFPSVPRACHTDLDRSRKLDLVEIKETLQAIQLGLDDMYAGRTVDAFEFVKRMRQKLQSAAKP
jgi:hypothetical protein